MGPYYKLFTVFYSWAYDKVNIPVFSLYVFIIYSYK